MQPAFPDKTVKQEIGMHFRFHTDMTGGGHYRRREPANPHIIDPGKVFVRFLQISQSLFPLNGVFHKSQHFYIRKQNIV